MKTASARLILISGEQGAGKTLFCQGFAEAARRQGRQVSGLISPGVFAENGLRIAIEAEDLHSGERRLLARLRTEDRPQSPDCIPDASAGLQQGKIQTQAWDFDPRQLEWGNQVLRRSVPADILIIDELGPLELERRQGWTEGLRAVDGAAYRLALVVIRPVLLPGAQARWPQAAILYMDAASRLPELVAELASRCLNG